MPQKPRAGASCWVDCATACRAVTHALRRFPCTASATGERHISACAVLSHHVTFAVVANLVLIARAPPCPVGLLSPWCRNAAALQRCGCSLSKYVICFSRKQNRAPEKRNFTRSARVALPCWHVRSLQLARFDHRWPSVDWTPSCSCCGRLQFMLQDVVIEYMVCLHTGSVLWR